MRLHDSRIHPSHIMLSLLIAAISMLFIALSAGYLYSRVQSGLGAIRLPWLFFVNIPVLAASGLTLGRARQCFHKDEAEGYRRELGSTVWLSLAFVGIQVLAWAQLFSREVYVASSLTGSYVYALSFLHVVHVLGGLPFLMWFAVQAHRSLRDPVSGLLYFSDEVCHRQLALITRYWHFLDLLWIFLVVFLGINMLW